MRPINLVAIIDDNEIDRFIANMVIEKTNLVDQIKTFSNGNDAINYLKANSKQPDLLPQIILLDLNMPIMDGFQFLEKYIKLSPRIGKKINIFIVSASISSVDYNQIKKISNVSDFIIKPITKEKFEEIVKVLKENPNSN